MPLKYFLHADYVATNLFPTHVQVKSEYEGTKHAKHFLQTLFVPQEMDSHLGHAECVIQM
jgi:hypothetical protein